MAKATDKAWERFGRTEPYFGVIAQPRFSQPNLADRKDFFQTGEKHVETLIHTIHEADPEFQPQRALDFGCGVGRITKPLASVCKYVVGADVSPSMLAEARKNCNALPNVEFTCTDTGVEALAGTFDFVHSFIVFQHIPIKRGLRIVQHLVSLLDARGWGALHFVYTVDAPKWWRASTWTCSHVPLAQLLANALRGRPPLRPGMQMNPYPLDRLFDLLQQAGCHRIQVRFSKHGQFPGIMLLFQRIKQPML